MTSEGGSPRTVFMGSPDFAVPFLEALGRVGSDRIGISNQTPLSTKRSQSGRKPPRPR